MNHSRHVLWMASLLAGAGLLGSGRDVQGNVPHQVTSRYEARIYGYVKLDASYDTQRTAVGNIALYVLPEEADGKRDEFNMTARETRLGLDLQVPDIGAMRVTGKVEADFCGCPSENAPNPRMRLAYADLAGESWSVRAGQDWDAFIPVLPRMVNFSSLAHSGALGLRRPQLRITHVRQVSNHAQIVTRVAAARTIGGDIDGDGQNDGAAAGYPSAQGRLALETQGWTERPIIVSVSGHAGTESVSSMPAENPSDPPGTRAKDYDSWSVIGGLILPLSERIVLQGTVWQGENLQAYFGAIGQGVNVDQQRGIRAEGGWAQLLFNPVDHISLNVGYGVDDPNSGDLADGGRSRNTVMFASVFYTFMPPVTLAFEYMNMKTTYKNASEAVNNRFQAAIKYDF